MSIPLRLHCPRCGTELRSGHGLLSCQKCRSDFVIEFDRDGVEPLLLAIKRGLYYDRCEFDPRHPNFAKRRAVKLTRKFY